MKIDYLVIALPNYLNDSDQEEQVSAFGSEFEAEKDIEMRVKNYGGAYYIKKVYYRG